MLKLTRKLWPVIILSIGSWPVFAQPAVTDGSLEVSGRIRIERESIKLQRKRFYLLPGGLAENQQLIDRLKTVDIVSRNCYYSNLGASQEFVCWLRQADCESPYCRSITSDDVERVPEFLKAFQKGVRQFGRRRPELARQWLTTNLEPRLRDGYYQLKKDALRGLLKGIRPEQSAMTDSVSVKAIFIDIPVGPSDDEEKKEAKYLVSNILPFEIGDKSYIWACEVTIEAGKTGRLLLKVPTEDRPVDDCEVIIRDLSVCRTGECPES